MAKGVAITPISSQARGDNKMIQSNQFGAAVALIDKRLNSREPIATREQLRLGYPSH